MYTISGNDRHLAVAMLRSRVPLSAEQKDALAKELKDDPERRGYAGLEPADVLTLLAFDYEVPNPEPQGRIDREYVPALDVLNVLIQQIHADGQSSWRKISDAAQVDNRMWEVRNTVQTFASARESLRLTNPLVAAVLPGLVSARLLSPEAAQFLTTEPDPTWVPFVRVLNRAEAVLGPGAMPDLAEIAAALL